MPLEEKVRLKRLCSPPRPGQCPFLRELTYVFEEMGQAWANRLIAMLVAACHEVTAAGDPLSQDRSVYFRALYLEIITEGDAANPRAPPSGKRGRTRQSKAVNLLHRLHTYTDDVLRFMADPGVPFTNNLAEQAVRMPKVKHKVSGCFRTLAARSPSASSALTWTLCASRAPTSFMPSP